MVSPKAIAVAGLIAIAASGCSGDSDAEAESPQATTTEQVETQPPAQSALNFARFRAAFKESFGSPGDEPPWYRHITGMKMTHQRLDITTDLHDPDNVGHDTVRTICLAAIKFYFNLGTAPDEMTGAVFGSDGVMLGGCA